MFETKFLRRTFVKSAWVLPLAFIAGCGGGSSGVGGGQANTFFGAVRPMANGTARSFVSTNEQGQPTSVGVEFSESAFLSLPTEEGAAYQLPLPAAAPTTLVDHIQLDWEPHGHPPAGVYNVPHFDVHFYTINQAERNAITPGSNSNSPQPAAKYIAQDYVTTGDTVPFMGVHYLDSRAPELNPPKPFDKTFVYGFNKGKLAFFEPMISKSFLQSKPNFSGQIKQPQAFQRTGAYPTSYSIKYDAATKLYRVTLEGLTSRTPG